jgi:hypothetical protein
MKTVTLFDSSITTKDVDLSIPRINNADENTIIPAG